MADDNKNKPGSSNPSQKPGEMDRGRQTPNQPGQKPGQDRDKDQRSMSGPSGAPGSSSPSKTDSSKSGSSTSDRQEGSGESERDRGGRSSSSSQESC